MALLVANTVLWTVMVMVSWHRACSFDSHDNYTVRWICALPLEMAAAKLMLGAIQPSIPILSTDQNTYILGNIGEHNIVIACLPSGAYGTISAATVAMQLLSSFHSIRFGFMVGIGGGVPSKADIRLGDIVVSQPAGTSGGVIQYDLGKVLSGSEFQRTGMLNRPPKFLLTALAALQAYHLTEDNHMSNSFHQARRHGHYLGSVLPMIQSFLPKLKRANYAVELNQAHNLLMASNNTYRSRNHRWPSGTVFLLSLPHGRPCTPCGQVFCITTAMLSRAALVSVILGDNSVRGEISGLVFKQRHRRLGNLKVIRPEVIYTSQMPRKHHEYFSLPSSQRNACSQSRHLGSKPTTIHRR